MLAAFVPCCRAGARVTLEWDPSPDLNITGYNLYLGEVEIQPIRLEFGRTTTATVGGLVPGSRYFFFVTAVDTSGSESTATGMLNYTVPTDLTNNAVSATIPSLTKDLVDQTELEGSSVKLNVEAESLTPMSYQWLRNGTLLSEEHSASLAISNASVADSGVYLAVIQNADGATFSRSAALLITPRKPSAGDLTISSLPRSTVAWNRPLTLEFAVSGTDTPPPLLQFVAESSDERLLKVSVGEHPLDVGTFVLSAEAVYGQTGNATATIRVTDANGQIASRSVEIGIQDPWLSFDAPEVLLTKVGVEIPVQTVRVFTADPTAANRVVLMARSLNPELVTTESIFVGGIGATRQFAVYPIPGRQGEATLRLTAVLDDVQFTQDIIVRIVSEDTPPTMQGVPTQLDVLPTESRSWTFQAQDAEDDSLQINILVDPPEFRSLVTVEGTALTRTVTITPGNSDGASFELTVVVQDSAGLIAVSRCSVRIVKPELRIQRILDELVIQWSPLNGVTIETAADPRGIWKPLTELSAIVDQAAGQVRFGRAETSSAQFFRFTITRSDSSSQ